MAVFQKRLSGPARITTTSSVAYTVPEDTTTIVKQIILTNITTSAKGVTIRLKPMNDTETDSHDILSNIIVNANETVSFNCSMVLINNGNTASNTTSDQITALCSANSSINVSIFGIEETA
jgi:hypothetical protein